MLRDLCSLWKKIEIENLWICVLRLLLSDVVVVVTALVLIEVIVVAVVIDVFIFDVSTIFAVADAVIVYVVVGLVIAAILRPTFKYTKLLMVTKKIRQEFIHQRKL